jgi:hypothetical protein
MIVRNEPKSTRTYGGGYPTAPSFIAPAQAHDVKSVAESDGAHLFVTNTSGSALVKAGCFASTLSTETEGSLHATAAQTMKCAGKSGRRLRHPQTNGGGSEASYLFRPVRAGLPSSQLSDRLCVHGSRGIYPSISPSWASWTVPWPHSCHVLLGVLIMFPRTGKRALSQDGAKRPRLLADAITTVDPENKPLI